MVAQSPEAHPRQQAGPARARLGVTVVAFLCAALGGCASISNPVADGVPVRKLPPEVIGQRREDEKTIPLTLLRQRPPEVYRLAPGDLLGVWIEGVLGEKGQPPPLRLPEQGNLPPAFGYPIAVRDDGTIALPLVDPLKVAGMTVTEVQDEIIKDYTVTNKILQPGRGRVIVSVMRQRQYHILVVRQDTGTVAVGTGGGGTAQGSIGQTKRGTGYVVDLPAYENDVLNALARTGGLPGLDAKNEVIIERGTATDLTDPDAVGRCLEQGPGGHGANAVHIPLRLRPGEVPPFTPEDVVLRSGDIVFIESRDTEVFYTGGLLPPQQHVLPRDYSIDVVEAISLVNGPLVNGAQNINNLSGNLVQTGIGFPSPSLVTVLRKTPGGGQIPIRVSLNRALRDPRERVLIQPGDILILQETPAEAVAQYFSEVFHLNFLGTIIRQRDLTGTATLSVP